MFICYKLFSGCAHLPALVVSWQNSWKIIKEETWHPCRLTGIKHVYWCFFMIKASSVATKEPLVLGLHRCHAANCLPGWTMADGRWRGGRKWKRVLPWIVIDSSLWAFFCSRRLRVGKEVGAEVQKNPPPPPRLYWVCCHFPPIVQFEWGRGAKHSGKLYSTHCVYILFFPF